MVHEVYRHNLCWILPTFHCQLKTVFSSHGHQTFIVTSGVLVRSSSSSSCVQLFAYIHNDFPSSPPSLHPFPHYFDPHTPRTSPTFLYNYDWIFSSIFPSTIRLWNDLPADIKSGGIEFSGRLGPLWHRPEQGAGWQPPISTSGLNATPITLKHERVKNCVLTSSL